MVVDWMLKEFEVFFDIKIEISETYLYLFLASCSENC